MKIFQKLIQLAGIIFLVWLAILAVSDAKHSDYNKIFIFAILVPCYLAQWIIPKKFPQLEEARRRFFGKLVWLFMSLALVFIVLGFADFNASTSEWFVPVIAIVSSILVASNCARDELSRKLSKKESNDAVQK